jgi:hypothetical protein
MLRHLIDDLLVCFRFQQLNLFRKLREYMTQARAI